MLCFTFSMRIILITHWWFSCCSVLFVLSQGLFNFSGCACLQIHKKPGSMARTADPNWPKRCSIPQNYTIPYHAQYINCVELAGRGWSYLCVTCFSQVLFFSLFLLSPFSLLLTLLLSYFISVIKLFCLNPWVLPFSGSHPHPCGGWGGVNE